MTPREITARDRLRMYLEQRKELGESELVLDALPVDAVLKLIGAPATSAGSAAGRARTTEVRESSVNERGGHSGAGVPQHDMPSNDVSRDDVSHGDASHGDASHGDASHGDMQHERASAAQPPAEPVSRLDPNANTDWRATLSGLNSEADRKSSFASSKPTSPATPVRDRTLATSQGASSSTSSSSSPVAPSAVLFPSWLTDLGLPMGLTASPASGAAGDAATFAAANAQESLQQLASVIAGCRACALGATALNPVPGEGNPNADIVCVGEAPGQMEDETGRPFVGPAGELLTKILGAIQLKRDDVFICNVLKHRPPGNRNPLPEEVHACTPYLSRQLALLKPKVILALGTFAAHTLLNTNSSLSKLRGQLHIYQGIPLIVTYHPAALLRNDAWKRPTWDDVKLARRVLDAARAASAQS